MSFLRDIVDFPSDSSSDEEDISPKGLRRNPPIREKPDTIHRLSNLDETLRNMPYNQNYNTITHNGKSSQSSNSRTNLFHRVRFSDTSTSNNNSDSRTNEIKTLEDKISRLQKIIKIKTDENRKNKIEL